jgi:hypothetical protein
MERRHQTLEMGLCIAQVRRRSGPPGLQPSSDGGDLAVDPPTPQLLPALPKTKAERIWKGWWSRARRSVLGRPASPKPADSLFFRRRPRRFRRARLASAEAA